MNFSFILSFEFLIVAVIIGVTCCYVGANNPEWFSQRWKDIKKTAELAKEKEGRQQIISDAIAEYERQKSKLKE